VVRFSLWDPILKQKMRLALTGQRMRAAKVFPPDALVTTTPIYFLHIPKTAGTTIQHILATKFGDKSYPHGLWDNKWNDNFTSLDSYDAFSGQFGFAFLQILGRTPWIFTFLRDPFERTASHFLHLKRDQGHPYYKYLSDKTFEEFVFDPFAVPLIYNFQARYLACPFTAVACGAKIPHGQMTNVVTVTRELMSYGMSDDELRLGAFAAVEKLNFVGFVELMEESVGRLARHLDLNVVEAPRLNVNV
jgi:hypothetical protein